MIGNALEAFLLHRRWQGDTSAYVTFFSKEEGLIQAFYKGARTLKKKPLLQPFLPLWVTIHRRQGACYLQRLESDTLGYYYQQPSLFAAWYVNELLYYFLQPFEENKALYIAYKSLLIALKAAQTQQDIERLLRRFEYLLLKVCGYEVLLTHDAYAAAINSKQYYQFIAGEGFIPAQQGLLGQHILAFANDALEDNQVLAVSKYVMQHAISQALDGRPLQSRALWYAFYSVAQAKGKNAKQTNEHRDNQQ